MRMNMGTAARWIRLGLAGIVGLVVLTGQVSGLTAMLLTMGAIAVAASGLTGFCPMYAPLRIDTSWRRKH